MESFVTEVYRFISQLTIYIGRAIQNISSTTTYDLYIAFLDKQILGGTLINLGLTWRDLFMFISTWAIIILFIIFIFKLVSGIFRFFFIGR